MQSSYRPARCFYKYGIATDTPLAIETTETEYVLRVPRNFKIFESVRAVLDAEVALAAVSINAHLDVVLSLVHLADREATQREFERLWRENEVAVERIAK